MNTIARVYYRESESQRFNNAIIFTIVIHIVMIFLKAPTPHTLKPAKTSVAIKMEFIAPPKEKTLFIKKEILKEAGSETGIVENGNLGDPNSKLTGPMQKSKAGSEKNGQKNSPMISQGGTGEGKKGGYSFNRGNGLKALLGNGNMEVIAGQGNSNARRGIANAEDFGSAIGGKGNQLGGEYSTPGAKGDGSGHLLGKDEYGNFDKSTSTKGILNKKGFETAFVQPETVVLGSIDPELLRKILSEYLQQFKYCYQQELQENSEQIKGIIDLNFRISAEGTVSSVNIKSGNTKFSTKGIACMSNVLRMINFPRPKGGGLVDVRQPLNFQSEQTKI